MPPPKIKNVFAYGKLGPEACVPVGQCQMIQRPSELTCSELRCLV